MSPRSPAGLKPGDACPVCGGKVGELQSFDRADLEAAERAHLTARKAESDARSSLQNATNAMTKATMTLETSQRRLRDLEEQRARVQQSLRDSLGDAEPLSLEAIDEALAQQTQARQQREALQAELEQASSQRQRLATQIEGAREQLVALEGRVAEIDGVGRKLSSRRRGRRLSRRVAGRRAFVDRRLNRLARWLATLSRYCAVAPIRLSKRNARPPWPSARSKSASSTFEDDVERARTLRKDLAGLKQEHDVAADLSLMLQANRFQAFIQQEALETLAADGSRRLEQLSSGRYRLQVDERGQEFEVIDQWNADQARSVRTLSGGETFLASLALSLALAESLPGLAASRRVVLDSVFLDEGFGSLDAEALDRAADALDALRNENRMVCIVTHLQELAQRLPARIVVTKSESGSTVAIA